MATVGFDDTANRSARTEVAQAQVASQTLATLRDGTCVSLRPANANDNERLRQLSARLRGDTSSVRFLAAASILDCGAGRHSQNEAASGVTLVATIVSQHGQAGDTFVHDSPLVGFAHFAPSAPGEAEVALIVAERYRRRGIGALLMRYLADLACARGISTFVADVGSANIRVFNMIRQAAIPVTWAGSGGELRLLLDVRAMAEMADPAT